MDLSLPSDAYIQHLNAAGYCMSFARLDRDVQKKVLPDNTGCLGTKSVFNINLMLTCFISRQRAFLDTPHMHELEWNIVEGRLSVRIFDFSRPVVVLRL